ncbi:MAG: leucine-rich repeat protein, partial [Clostridia bacterium]|nr:leucine-rich repeat protein [Clostridia bacterium]
MIEKIEEKISGKNKETKKFYEKDLDRIKKLYGEGMARFCRANLSSILDDPGELPRLMEKFFAPSRILCDTIKDNNIDQFCEFMLGEYFYEKGDTQEFVEDIGTPEEIFDKAGYKFYHCKTVEDVEQFMKYYASGEAICTFNNIEGRLHSNDIFWAVKKDVDEIKREDFENPERQDRYGTSVISLQFHKSASHKLSIKNRYNHAVSGCNCDATFSNNLDNIYRGLAHSFEKHYGLKQNFPRKDFYLYNQVRDMEGRFHTYNVRIGDYYFCNDNVIIKRDRGIDACSMPEKENYKYIELDKARYEVVENYIIDKKEKTIKTLHEFTESYVVDRTEKELKAISAEIDPTMTGLEIEQIEVTRVKGTTDKIIHIVAKGDIKLDLTINANNQIVEVFNSGLEYVEPGFLQYCSNIKKFTALDLKKLSGVNMESLEVVNLPAIEEGGNYFLNDARKLKEAYLPNLKKVGKYFLSSAYELEKLDVPSLTYMGECSLVSETIREVSFPSLLQMEDYCLSNCEALEKFDAPKLEMVGNYVLDKSYKIKEVNIPNVKTVGSNFLARADSLEVFNAPSLATAGIRLLESAKSLKEFYAKNLVDAGANLLCWAGKLKTLYAPSLQVLRANSLVHINLEELSLPSLEKIEEYCLGKSDSLTTINLPKLKTVATGCFQFASNIEEIVLPVLTEACEGFFKDAPNLERTILPSLKVLTRYSFENVKNLKKLYAPNLREIQNFSFTSVPRLKEATLTNLEMVGDWSFGQMSALERLDLPNLIEVGGGCFSEARSLQQLSVPKVELIKDFAFEDIDKVQYLNLPNLRVIGKGCFDNARNLQRLYAPNISYLGKNNFHTTQKLESVTLTNLQEM